MTAFLTPPFRPTGRSLSGRRAAPLAVRWLLLAAVVGLGMSASRADAQAAPKVALRFSQSPDVKVAQKSTRSQVLRPNVAQELFAYVRNDEQEKARQVTVQLRSGETVLAAKTLTVAGREESDTEAKWTPVPWPQLDAKALKWVEVQRPVYFRLLDRANKPIGPDVRVDIDRPGNYVTASLNFDPEQGARNRLEAVIRPRDTFQGPPCRVELDVRPAPYIPDLIPGQKKRGYYADALTARNRSVVLQADNLAFRGTGTKSGLVFLTVDGYERAFTFKTTFAQSGTPPAPDRIQKPAAVFRAPRYADPSKPVPIVLEIDDLAPEDEDTVRVKVDLIKPVAPRAKGKARDKDEAADADPVSELAEYRGERSKRLFFAGGGLRGGLLFRPEVKSWYPDLDLSSVYGPTRLRMRLLSGKNAKAEPLLFRDLLNDKPDVDALYQTVILDDTAPENLRFVNLVKTAVRGRTLGVQAMGDDLESGVREVLFWQGKPLADGKIPPDATVIPGKATVTRDKETIWSVDMFIPAEQPGLLPVSAQFVNNVGLRKNIVTVFRVVDPEKVVAKGDGKLKVKASIAGQVVEGDRTQKGLTVVLANEAGKPLASAKTDDTGKYLFKDLDPGTYRVSTAKSASMTSAEQVVTVTEGEKKVDVELKLYR